MEHDADGAAEASARTNALAARDRLAQLAARMVNENGLYLDNVLAADQGRWVEPHWRRAIHVAANANADANANARRRVSARVRYGTADQSSLRAVVASVVTASRAHIRFDRGQWRGSTLVSPAGRVTGLARMASRHGSATSWRWPRYSSVRRSRRMSMWPGTPGCPSKSCPGGSESGGCASCFAPTSYTNAPMRGSAEALVAAGGAGDNPYIEPEAGPLEGDVTAGQRADPFVSLESGLRPTMDGLRRAPADALARAEAGFPDGLDTVERVRALQGLCHGHTGAADERAIIALLATPARSGDVVAVVNGVGAWELAANLHGREKRAPRTYYYPHVQPSIAAALARRASHFAELAWEETMAADLLCDRPDAAALLAAIGGDKRSGWQRIERDLSRTARSRVLAAKPELAQ